MPREIIHWHVLTEARKRLRDRGYPLLAKACDRFHALSLLGSIGHDAPYYYRMGEDPFEATADYMHGSDGEDTLDPIRRLLAARDQVPQHQDALCAFLFGLCSHIGADTTFHPMVFYFTGNYHDPDLQERVAAQGRHRLIETYLDSWTRPRTRFAHGWHIGPLLDEAEPALATITDLLESVLVPERLFHPAPAPPHRAARWREGFRAISKFQALFLSPSVGFVVRAFTLSGNPTLRSIDALSSHRRLRPKAIFDAPLTYRNPISGEQRIESVEQMLERSIEESISFAGPFESVLSGEPNPDLFSHRKGASLNFGIVGAAASSAVHFSDDGFPLPGLIRRK